MTREDISEKFAADVANHQMEILLDSGVYRHLRFRKLGTYCMGFDIVTWPGYLSISGDMGCYVFARLNDMFDFFRHDIKDGQIRINTGYWAEKCQAQDKHGGIKNFSLDLFRQEVKEWADRDEELSEECCEAIEEELIDTHFDNEHDAIGAAMEFEHEGARPFQDFWEVCCREYDYHYLWCCYAIVWAISQYDKRGAK